MRLTEHISLVGGGDASFSLSHPCDCSVYLLDGGNELALIDAGCGLDFEALERQIRGDGLNPAKISAVLLTHAHGDHAGGAADFQRRYGAKVYALEPAADFVRAGNLEAMSIQPAIDAGVYPPGYRFPACEVTTLTDGETLTVGSLSVRAFSTPGHSAGHACYLAEADGALNAFTGDLITHGGKIALQVIWDCELKPYYESIRRLAALNPGRLFPGHGCFSLSRASAQLEPALERMNRLKLPQNALD